MGWKGYGLYFSDVHMKTVVSKKNKNISSLSQTNYKNKNKNDSLHKQKVDQTNFSCIPNKNKLKKTI